MSEQAQHTDPAPRLRYFRDQFGRVYQDFFSTDLEVHPPTQRFRYHAASDPGKVGIQVEMQVFKPGTVLGEGTVPANGDIGIPANLCEFTPARGISPTLLDAGRVQARLADGRITAEAIK